MIDHASVEAYESIKPRLKAMHKRVLDYLHIRGENGTTADEMERDLELIHQTGSPRLTELKQMGLIVKSGRFRPTQHGRRANVYVLVMR